MRLTTWEEERLLVFTAAELARRHRSTGLALNAPEAIALICDAMFEAARAGATYAEIESAGRAAVAPDQVMPGVRELVGDVRLEVLMDDGVRLVVLVDPLGSADAPGDGPGATRLGGETKEAPARETVELEVRSTSRRPIRVSSHFPFDRVNARLAFDREAARGLRLDVEAGESVRWSPGETRTVRLVRFGGAGGES
jgi:urease subunit gamma/beta